MILQILGMIVWAIAGAILLTVLMWIDSLFTKYKDLAEIKKGNMAVTSRFVMKLFAQGYILSQSIAKSDDLWQAVLASVVSFAILLVLEKLVEFFFRKFAGIDLDEGTKQGQLSYALVAGTLHIVGALVLGAYL
ncbi:DUF350 domain-containing protein [Brevibacillus fulvus]|uniref:Uncharacterized membrane protein YjfL (UPF0719 family) n=1 Tax=Brevibacillus fulvus TaxID=1125967 RepID=A0A938Y534_9BACL|nr:DUF350 domain-containing protein [Brevibacillus fulvus]MBM7592086.1 uncharacterized membrane protein YjfL (UPF0719 family) [Brevibacillus fulvus]